MRQKQELEAALALSAYKMGVSKEEVDQLKQLCLKLGRETPYSPADIARAAGHLSFERIPNHVILSTALPQLLTEATKRDLDLRAAATITAKMQ